ncbi:hypothetical protein Rsub_06777 [Raphidocelis subcapitata]|uniref:Pentacotripeptide-repeat region of PRORP domain-containing protein n=1 Tax=Raphidocelis subcapitata TaxID=307507 RepID=A0A2V0P1D6_9CHLO|nr:hypothetical protein Rsub_06777 [Raphidocelis subcapitata]|eukprot:GBF93674.1 hypothetical protein Rsub_06777 [Raphidocelis subcapitata]
MAHPTAASAPPPAAGAAVSPFAAAAAAAASGGFLSQFGSWDSPTNVGGGGGGGGSFFAAAGQHPFALASLQHQHQTHQRLGLQQPQPHHPPFSQPSDGRPFSGGALLLGSSGSGGGSGSLPSDLASLSLGTSDGSSASSFGHQPHNHHRQPGQSCSPGLRLAPSLAPSGPPFGLPSPGRGGGGGGRGGGASSCGGSCGLPPFAALMQPAAGGGSPPPPPPLRAASAGALLRCASADAAAGFASAQQQLCQQQLQLGRAATQMLPGRCVTGAAGGLPQHRLADCGGGCYIAATAPQFPPVFDMKSLAATLSQVQAGTGDVRRVLAACTFRPRLPGLTKLVSNLTKDGNWAKALELYESLDAVGVRPDTTITNAAISACDKGGQWEAALALFRRMADAGMGRDAITYSAVISALSKGRQWGLAIDVFNHMVFEGVECDAVTCCSLITALDKGGQWQMAEQVFRLMYACDPSLAPLLEGMGDTPCGAGAAAAASVQGAFSLAALDALSGGGGGGGSGGGAGAPDAAAALPPAEELAAALVAGAAAAPPGTPPAVTRGERRDGFGRGGSASPPPPPPPPPLLPGSPPACGAGGDGGPAAGGEPHRGGGSIWRAAAAAAGGGGHSPEPGQPPLPAAGQPPAFSPLRPPLAPSPAPPPPAGPPRPAGDAPPSPPPAPAAAPAPPQRPLERSPSGGAGLARSGSGGLSRAGSISAKKASPNRVCCNALLASYARAAPAQWRRALALLRGMWACGGELTPDIVSYNTAIKAAGAAARADEAFSLFHQMRSRGIEPTAATFGALLAVASEAGAWGRVAEAWGALQASGLPVHVGCANTYLTALVKLGDWPAAFQLLSAMRACGGALKPNVATYNALIAGCAEAGHAGAALNLFEELLSCGLAPNHATLAAAAAAHARAGDWPRAGEALRAMHNPAAAPGFGAAGNGGGSGGGGSGSGSGAGGAAPPPASAYGPLFGVLEEAALGAEAGGADRAAACARAVELYSLLLNQGVPPDAPLYEQASPRALWAGRARIIATFAACGAPAMVLRLALTLVDRRWPLSPATLCRALDAAAAQRAWGAAPRLLRGALDACGARAPAAALRALLLRCAGEQAWGAAEEIIQCCADGGQLDAVASGLPGHCLAIPRAAASDGGGGGPDGGDDGADGDGGGAC